MDSPTLAGRDTAGPGADQGRGIGSLTSPGGAV
jgi:hypothetical protein